MARRNCIVSAKLGWIALSSLYGSGSHGARIAGSIPAPQRRCPRSSMSGASSGRRRSLGPVSGASASRGGGRLTEMTVPPIIPVVIHLTCARTLTLIMGTTVISVSRPRARPRRSTCDRRRAAARGRSGRRHGAADRWQAQGRGQPAAGAAGPAARAQSRHRRDPRAIACRWCGEPLAWPRPVGITFADGTASAWRAPMPRSSASGAPRSG